MYMNGNITFDSLPSAIEELAGKVDYIINLLGTKIEKREEIPKYLNTEITGMLAANTAKVEKTASMKI